MIGNKLDVMRRHSTNGNILKGREFPDHIQTAYGRHTARLFFGVSVFGGGLWLRDLPLSLFDLDWHGHKRALEACLEEIFCLFYAGKISIVDIQNSPFHDDFVAHAGAELSE